MGVNGGGDFEALKCSSPSSCLQGLIQAFWSWETHPYS